MPSKQSGGGPDLPAKFGFPPVLERPRDKHAAGDGRGGG